MTVFLLSEVWLADNAERKDRELLLFERYVASNYEVTIVGKVCLKGALFVNQWHCFLHSVGGKRRE